MQLDVTSRKLNLLGKIDCKMQIKHVQRLVQIVQLAKNLGINIIYSEDLVDPRSSQTVADETPGGKVMARQKHTF